MTYVHASVFHLTNHAIYRFPLIFRVFFPVLWILRSGHPQLGSRQAAMAQNSASPLLNLPPELRWKSHSSSWAFFWRQMF